MAEFLPLGHRQDWVYYRSSHNQRLTPAQVEYPRRVLETGIVEGRLVDRAVVPLSSHLSEHQEPDPGFAASATTLLDGGTGTLVRFDPALPLYPRMLAVGDSVEMRAAAQFFDQTGRFLYKGRVTRRVICEGSESVSTPAGEFDACVRLRVEMELYLYGGPYITTTEYVWLGREIGEIRRLEHIAAWFWFFFFESTTEYELVSYEAGGTEPEATTLPAPRSLADQSVQASAVLLERTRPHPLVGGLYHQFATPAAGRTLNHAAAPEK